MDAPSRGRRNVALYLLWVAAVVAAGLAILWASRAQAELRHAFAFGLDETALANARALQYVWTLAAVLLGGLALAVSAVRHR